MVSRFHSFQCADTRQFAHFHTLGLYEIHPDISAMLFPDIPSVLTHIHARGGYEQLCRDVTTRGFGADVFKRTFNDAQRPAPH